MKFIKILIPCVMATALAAGCAKQESGNKPVVAKAKKFYWVQPLKGHPTHQMTQIAFMEGCKQLGYQGEVIGTDGADLSGTIALAEQVLAKATPPAWQCGRAILRGIR